MQDKISKQIEKQHERERQHKVQKIYSDRPKKKQDKIAVKIVKNSQSIPQAITYLLMKQKFQQIYKRIQKISSKEEHRLLPIYRLNNNPQIQLQIKAINCLNPQGQYQETKPSITQSAQQKKIQANQSLQINTVSQTQFTRSKGMQGCHIRKTRYRKAILEPLPRVKMSNNIKDYLSVQRISIRDTYDQSVIKNKSLKFATPKKSNLIVAQPVKQIQQLSTYQSTALDQKPKKPEIIVKKKFKAPFQLYYYRDFIWKIAFSNQLIVEPPEQYETKFKFYVGPGNNSNLIKGIMKRRPWFTLTDKMNQNSFVWTQIKVASYFQTQINSQARDIKQQEKHLINQLRQQKHKLLSKQKQDGKISCIFNQLQQKKWKTYWNKHIQLQNKIKQNLKNRTKALNGILIDSKLKKQIKLHNHFLHNYLIGNKKNLFNTMSQYYSKTKQDVFQYLPLTFHIKKGLEDDQYLKFLQHFYSINKAIKSDVDYIHKYNVWIVKPGQNTNRGNGITVCLELNDIKTLLKKQQKHPDGSLKTYILQKYIERPLLYKRRKFDLRHYMMISSSNGLIKGYWYKQGYVRTTSSQYTLKFSHGSVHLTNDAVQKNLPDYGKFQKGNKLFYEQLDLFIKKQDSKFDFFRDIYPKMKKIATDVIHASAVNIDPLKKMNNFEIFGLDFMIDEKYDVWLIQVNTNPCLQTTCPVLARIIPRFVQNVFQVCVDPVFPAPLAFVPKYQPYLNNLNQQNQLQLVFDSRYDGRTEIKKQQIQLIEQDEDDVFDDDGQDFAD